MTTMLLMELLHTDGPCLGGWFTVHYDHGPLCDTTKFKHTLLSCIQTVEAAWFIGYDMNRVYIAGQILNSEHKLPNIHAHAPDVWHFTRDKNLEINSKLRRVWLVKLQCSIVMSSLARVVQSEQVLVESSLSLTIVVVWSMMIPGFPTQNSIKLTSNKNCSVRVRYS